MDPTKKPDHRSRPHPTTAARSFTARAALFAALTASFLATLAAAHETPPGRLSLEQIVPDDTIIFMKFSGVERFIAERDSLEFSRFVASAHQRKLDDLLTLGMSADEDPPFVEVNCQSAAGVLLRQPPTTHEAKIGGHKSPVAGGWKIAPLCRNLIAVVCWRSRFEWIRAPARRRENQRDDRQCHRLDEPRGRAHGQRFCRRCDVGFQRGLPAGLSACLQGTARPAKIATGCHRTRVAGTLTPASSL